MEKQLITTNGNLFLYKVKNSFFVVRRSPEKILWRSALRLPELTERGAVKEFARYRVGIKDGSFAIVRR